MFRQHSAWRGATWTLVAAALALPGAAQARFDNSPGVWPGAGMCVVLHGGHVGRCASHGRVRARSDNRPGVWPGAGMCVALSRGEVGRCGFHGPVGGSARETSKEKRAAASVSTATANAMQAAAVASGEANSVLSNPYVEEKVTTPESVGVNRTKIPAGGF